jgi:hypothetical protein
MPELTPEGAIPYQTDKSPWAKRANLKCEDCLFQTELVKLAMSHAEGTGHRITGPGAIEGTVLTISLERDGE